jgi:hypothetical protein
MAIGNNLMISPPKTQSGANVIAAARQAAQATGDMKKEEKKDQKEEKDDARDTEKQHAVANKESAGQDKKSSDDEKDKFAKQKDPEDLVASQTASREKSNENEFVFKLYKDKSNTTQIGWEWEGLSQNGRNYTNIVLPLDTKVQVVVSQDMQVNSYVFAPGGRAAGSITVVQQYR